MKPYITALTGTILILAVICAFVGCADKDHRPAGATERHMKHMINKLEEIVNHFIAEY